MTDQQISAKDAVKFAVEGRWQIFGGLKCAQIKHKNFAAKVASHLLEAVYFLDSANEAGNMLNLCKCTHLRLVANMDVKAGQVLVNGPVHVPPLSADKKPTTMKMNQKILATRP